MPRLTDYVFFVGWDSFVSCPIVIQEYHPGSGMWNGPGFVEAHPFLWWERRYGPMRKLEVTNLDGYGDRIADD